MPGLYNKNEFKDNCGFGLIAHKYGESSHAILTKSIDALVSMTHRGGIGSDGKTGDGCGLLINIDHSFFSNQVFKEQNIELPENFAIAQVFFKDNICLLYTSPSPRDAHESRMPSSA